MATAKENGRSAAAQHLGSMLLGNDSVERKDNNNDAEPAEKSGTTPTKTLRVRRVEKECDTVKKCNGCTCVSYCDQKIQNKHREEHAKECMRIQKELDKARRQARSSITAPKEIGPLGKLPPREECPIFMSEMPHHPKIQ